MFPYTIDDMNKPMLHEVNGKNRYCGPTAIATVLGMSTDVASAHARKVGGGDAIKGLGIHHLKITLEVLGCKVIRVHYHKAATRPTLSQWIKANGIKFKTQHVIIVAGNHYGTVLGRRYLCSLTHRLSTTLKDVPKPRARVTDYLMITQLPDSLPAAPPKPTNEIKLPGAPATKARITRLAKEWDITVDKQADENTIWVYPPDWVSEDDDEFIDEHYCDDWDEALKRVEHYIELIKKLKGQS